MSCGKHPPRTREKEITIHIIIYIIYTTLIYKYHRTNSPSSGADAHSLAHLDEGQHLVVYYGRWVILRQDCSHQDAFYKVLAGYKDMEAMATVFDTCLQDL